MSLEPFFSLTPRNPRAFNYNPASPSAPYGVGMVSFFGGYTNYGGYTDQIANRLEDHYTDNRMLLAYDPVLETETTITNPQNDIWRHCAVYVNIEGWQVSLTNQYLLVFRLERVYGSPIAQFFLGVNFVRAEALTQSPYDDIAVLVDVPKQQQVFMSVRLAAPDANPWHGFAFHGVDCYLL